MCVYTHIRICTYTYLYVYIHLTFGMKRARVNRLRGWEVLCPTLRAVRRLTMLKFALDAFLNGSEDAAVTKMAKRPSQWVGLPSAPALGSATREFMLRRSITLREFIVMMLLPCLDVALEFPTLFASTVGEDGAPCSCCIAVDQPVVSLTRRQVWCLLANMFFCAFRPRIEPDDDDSALDDADAPDWVDARLLPTTDYAEMLAAPEKANEIEVAKLLLLFDFFVEAQRWTSRQEMEEVEMIACRSRAAPALARSLLPRVWCAVPHASPSTSSPAALPPLLPVVLHPLGESIDDQSTMIRIDFANRCIGGGALSNGAVQEEITFAQCPALNTLRWYQTQLGHAESVVVTHYYQYGQVQPGTYGRTLHYGNAVIPPRACGGALLVVDALDFRFDTVDEYSQAAVYRELVKLIGGLSSPAVASLLAVAGGNWGCGVFGGDLELKLLLQWAACGVAGKELHYFPFDKAGCDRFIPHVTQRLRRGCAPPLTTENLISFLYTLEDVSDADEESARGDDRATAGDAFGFAWSSFLKHFCLLDRPLKGAT